MVGICREIILVHDPSLSDCMWGRESQKPPGGTHVGVHFMPISGDGWKVLCVLQLESLTQGRNALWLSYSLHVPTRKKVTCCKFGSHRVKVEVANF